MLNSTVPRQWLTVYANQKKVFVLQHALDATTELVWDQLQSRDGSDYVTDFNFPAK